MKIEDRNFCKNRVDAINILAQGNIVKSESTFLDLMFKLDDLMQMMNKHGHRIDFTDDIIREGQDVSDVTDLIAEIKNTNFQQELKLNNFDKHESLKFEFEHKDDIIISFGKCKIYYKKHIIRAFEECKCILFKKTNILKKIMNEGRIYIGSEAIVFGPSLYFLEEGDELPSYEDAYYITILKKNYIRDISIGGNPREGVISHDYQSLEDFIRADLERIKKKLAGQDVIKYLEHTPLPKRIRWANLMDDVYDSKHRRPWWSFLPLGIILFRIKTLWHVSQDSIRKRNIVVAKYSSIPKGKIDQFSDPYQKKIDAFLISQTFKEAKKELGM